MSRTAVVAFNLGGPDSLAAVRPFLTNLFSDPMILRLPAPVRFVLARLIAWRRTPVARAIYSELGGRSPILAETEAQAETLQEALGDPEAFRVFVAMRYWHPFPGEAAREVAAWNPDRVLLLPLYPQFSTSTTASFMQVWEKAAARAGLDAETRAVCCYPAEAGFVAATAALVREALGRIAAAGSDGGRIAGGRTPRVLFSAHGLPETFVAAGDPYCAQVEMTVAAVTGALAGERFEPAVSYQSRVGRLEWVKPYTEDEVRRAGADGVPLVVVPVAFVSEHSETLVELDIEYGRLARESGVPHYERVPAVGTHPDFIAGLARLVREALSRTERIAPDGGARLCDTRFGACPCFSPCGAPAGAAAGAAAR